MITYKYLTSHFQIGAKYLGTQQFLFVQKSLSKSLVYGVVSRGEQTEDQDV